MSILIIGSPVYRVDGSILVASWMTSKAGAEMGGCRRAKGKGASRFIAHKNEKAEKAPTPSSEVEEPGR